MVKFKPYEKLLLLITFILTTLIIRSFSFTLLSDNFLKLSYLFSILLYALAIYHFFKKSNITFKSLKPPKNASIALLSAISCLAVVVIHLTSKSAYTGYIRLYLNFAVPAFIMMLGYFYTYRVFNFTSIKHKLITVVIPFVVVSMLYSFYKNEPLLTFIKKPAEYHLWYFYILIPLYFFIPLVNSLTDKQTKAFLVLWAICGFLNQANTDIFDYQTGQLFFYLGYLLLGRAIRKNVFSKKEVFLSLTIAVISMLYASLNMEQGYLLLFSRMIDYRSISIMSYSFIIFHCFANFPITENKTVNFIDKYKLAIYLFHPFIIYMIVAFFPSVG